jgi:pilus assembly protein Flp/PilA
MIKQFVKFLKDEDGVTSVEYAIMAALIALVVIAGATVLGNNTNVHNALIETVSIPKESFCGCSPFLFTKYHSGIADFTTLSTVLKPLIPPTYQSFLKP